MLELLSNRLEFTPVDTYMTTICQALSAARAMLMTTLPVLG